MTATAYRDGESGGTGLRIVAAGAEDEARDDEHGNQRCDGSTRIDAELDADQDRERDESAEEHRFGNGRGDGRDRERTCRDHDPRRRSTDARHDPRSSERPTGAHQHELGHERRRHEHERRRPPTRTGGDPPRQGAEQPEGHGEAVDEEVVAHRRPQRSSTAHAFEPHEHHQVDERDRDRRGERGGGERERRRSERGAQLREHDGGEHRGQHAVAGVVGHAPERTLAPVHGVERPAGQCDHVRSEDRGARRGIAARSGREADHRRHQDRGFRGGRPLVGEERELVEAERDEQPEQHHGPDRRESAPRRHQRHSGRGGDGEDRPGVPASARRRVAARRAFERHARRASRRVDHATRSNPVTRSSPAAASPRPGRRSPPDGPRPDHVKTHDASRRHALSRSRHRPRRTAQDRPGQTPERDRTRPAPGTSFSEASGGTLQSARPDRGEPEEAVADGKPRRRQYALPSEYGPTDAPLDGAPADDPSVRTLPRDAPAPAPGPARSRRERRQSVHARSSRARPRRAKDNVDRRRGRDRGRRRPGRARVVVHRQRSAGEHVARRGRCTVRHPGARDRRHGAGGDTAERGHVATTAPPPSPDGAGARPRRRASSRTKASGSRPAAPSAGFPPSTPRTCARTRSTPRTTSA